MLDKRHRYMNLGIIVVLVLVVTIQALPKKTVQLDPSGGVFSQSVLTQFQTLLQPPGALRVAQFSRNNSKTDHFSMDLAAEKEDGSSSVWLVVYESDNKKPYRAYYNSEQREKDVSGLPTVEEAFASLNQLHPVMDQLFSTLTGEPVEGKVPFLSLHANYWWDGNLAVEQRLAEGKEPQEGGRSIEGSQVATLEGVRHFTFGDGTLTEGTIQEAWVDAESYLVYRSAVDGTTQVNHLVAIVNPAK